MWLMLLFVLLLWTTTPAVTAWMTNIPSTAGGHPSSRCLRQRITKRQHQCADTWLLEPRATSGPIRPHPMIAPQQLGSFETLNDNELMTADGTTITTEAPSGRTFLARRVRLHNWVTTLQNTEAIADDDNTKYHVGFQEAWDFQKALLQSHIDRLQMEQPLELPAVSTSDSPLLL